MLRTLFISTVILLAATQLLTAQKSNSHDSIRETRRAAIQEIREAKSNSNPVQALTAADFNDTDSFGRNAKFLGSLYAGTVYVYRSCDPQVLLDELGLALAADDHCLVHNSTAPLPQTTVFDPVWQITIPGNTVDNVIYPMLNNTVGFDAYPSDPNAFPIGNGYFTGATLIRFSPVVTIESVALNDPAAINPTTGLPMNGSYTTTLAGTRIKSFSINADDFVGENDSYASVAGRGFSRTYFASLGLPTSVINNLFKRPMTLKFGIRVNAAGPVQQAFFSYQFRLLGN